MAASTATTVATQLRSPRRRLQLVTGVAGAVFVWHLVHAPPFGFAQLPRAFAIEYRTRLGFFHVLRWLEQLDDADTLAAFLHTAATLPPSSTPNAPSVAVRSTPELLALVQKATTSETYYLLSKMVLQWGLLVFLARAKAISSRTAIPCVCLSMLSLLCAKMAQSSLVDILAHASTSAAAIGTDKRKDRAAFMAVFFNLLFLVRCVATAIVSGVLACAYQSYFGGWPPPRWRDVPRYIGSKNFALSTLFYGVACVSVMALTVHSLRSLSEAAYHIESFALVAALCHFLVHEMGLTADVRPTTTEGTALKPKQS